MPLRVKVTPTSSHCGEFDVGLPGSAGNGFTVTVALPVNWAEQLVEVMVAKTLKVVVEIRLPVGKLMVPPVPATAEPTGLLPASFLNW